MKDIKIKDNIKVSDKLDEYILKGLEDGIEIKKEENSNKRNNKKPYLKIATMVVVISVTIVGTMALTKENTWAYISILAGRIESFLDRDYSEFDKYKFEGNQSIEKDGLVLNLGDIILDDEQLIISSSIDYTNFDFEKHNIDKKDFMPDIPIVTIGDFYFPGQGGGIISRDIEGENKKEFLYTVDLSKIDTDKDDIGDTPIEILDELEKNKDYNLKIYFKNFDIGESKEEKGLLLSKSFGDWEFNINIDRDKISKDLKIIKVNKVIEAEKGNEKIKLKIEEVRVSPISVNIKTTVEGDTSEDMSSTSLVVKDQKGKDLLGGSEGNLNGNKVNYRFELKGGEKKITIIPVVYVSGESKYFEDEKIEIDIP